jgi:hypothetical protein
MASVFSESSSPDPVRISSTEILSPLVNNNRYAYGFSCGLNGDGTDLGFFGATVRYTLTGSGGASI